MIERTEYKTLKDQENAVKKKLEHREKLAMDKARFEKRWERAKENAEKAADKVGKFEDRGMQNVSVSEVNLPHREELDSLKYSRAVELSKSLPEVQKRLKQGWTKEKFRELWNSPSQADKHLARTYESFYGHDRIKLTKDGKNPYEITNGRHRIYAANELGISSVPAHVHERRA